MDEELLDELFSSKYMAGNYQKIAPATQKAAHGSPPTDWKECGRSTFVSILNSSCKSLDVSIILYKCETWTRAVEAERMHAGVREQML